jgi:Uma2 family endonuclease
VELVNVEVGLVTDEEFEALIAAGDYEREPELIDGHIEWRDNELTTTEHGEWVTALTLWFGNHRAEWNIRVFPEVTNKPAPLNSLIPDVTVISGNSPREKYVTSVPLAVFEVLSPRQSQTILNVKFAKYAQRGIPQIWFIDPEKQIWKRYTNGKLTPSDTFTATGKIPEFSMQEISKLVL